MHFGIQNTSKVLIIACVINWFCFRFFTFIFPALLFFPSRLALRPDRGHDTGSSNSLPGLPERTHTAAAPTEGGRTTHEPVPKTRGAPQSTSDHAPPSERRHTGTPKTGSATTVHAGSSSAKRKHHGHRSGHGSKRGGRGVGGATQEETPEQHAVKNLNIFEKNLADLHLPVGAAGRRR